MNETISKIISQLYDIGKFKEKCNSKECERSPTKVVTVYYYTLNKGRVDIANIFLCDTHLESINTLKDILKNTIKNTVIIETETKNIKQI
jgi:hypothetical protein